MRYYIKLVSQLEKSALFSASSLEIFNKEKEKNLTLKLFVLYNSIYPKVLLLIFCHFVVFSRFIVVLQVNLVENNATVRFNSLNLGLITLHFKIAAYNKLIFVHCGLDYQITVFLT